MFQHYKFPLKVWLTASTVGTILFYLYNFTEGVLSGAISEPLSINNVFWFLIAVAISATLSVPAWLLLWWIYWKTQTQQVSKTNQFPIILIATQLLCWSTFYVVFSLDDGSPFRGNLDVILPYCAALIIAVLINRSSIKDES